MTDAISQERALLLYETMVRIRRFEESVIGLFAQGRVPGFLHTYVGQEAVAAGVCAVLRSEDRIISTHRGHGHLIARGGRLDLMMAELFGKRDGYCGGKGGSMHIADPDLNMLGANAIVGAGLPIINGAALASQYLDQDWIGVCFFGDGASNTGAFHEALNLASVWNLPSIFVCENNRLAESTPQHQHQKVKKIAIRALAYDIASVTIDGNDVAQVYHASKEAADRARAGGGPTLLEALTDRWRGHYEGDPQNYRQRDETEERKSKCPIHRWRDVLLEMGIANSRLTQLESDIAEEIAQAIEFAEASPEPMPSDAYTDIYTPLPEEG